MVEGGPELGRGPCVLVPAGAHDVGSGPEHPRELLPPGDRVHRRSGPRRRRSPSTSPGGRPADRRSSVPHHPDVGTRRRPRKSPTQPTAPAVVGSGPGADRDDGPSGAARGGRYSFGWPQAPGPVTPRAVTSKSPTRCWATGRSTSSSTPGAPPRSTAWTRSRPWPGSNDGWRLSAVSSGSTGGGWASRIGGHPRTRRPRRSGWRMRWPCWMPSAPGGAVVLAPFVVVRRRPADGRVTHPDRVTSLIIVNGAARAAWAPDYPEGIPQSMVDLGMRFGAPSPMPSSRATTTWPSSLRASPTTRPSGPGSIGRGTSGPPRRWPGSCNASCTRPMSATASR